MQLLTHLQSKVWTALQGQLRQGDLNIKRLGAELGMADTTIREHVRALARKGYLHYESRGPGRQPYLRLLAGGVPLVGHIAAGSLSEALEFPEGYLKLAAYPGRFGLRVRGYSMEDLIRDGDVVLLTKRPYKSGEICAVRVDHSDATLKYVDHDPRAPETVLLRPHNPDYAPQRVAATQLEVDGVFSALLRGDVIDELLEEPMT